MEIRREEIDKVVDLFLNIKSYLELAELRAKTNSILLSCDSQEPIEDVDIKISGQFFDEIKIFIYDNERGERLSDEIKHNIFNPNISYIIHLEQMKRSIDLLERLRKEQPSFKELEGFDHYEMSDDPKLRNTYQVMVGNHAKKRDHTLDYVYLFLTGEAEQIARLSNNPDYFNDLDETGFLDQVVAVDKVDKPKTFESIFEEKYKHHVDKFTNILRDSEAMEAGQKPLLSDDNRWIGNKQAAMVFYKELLTLDVVVQESNATIGLLFEARFENLNRSFSSKSPGDTANDYKDYFKKEISRIKTKLT